MQCNKSITLLVKRSLTLLRDSLLRRGGVKFCCLKISHDIFLPSFLKTIIPWVVLCKKSHNNNPLYLHILHRVFAMIHLNCLRLDDSASDTFNSLTKRLLLEIQFYHKTCLQRRWAKCLLFKKSVKKAIKMICCSDLLSKLQYIWVLVVSCVSLLLANSLFPNLFFRSFSFFDQLERSWRRWCVSWWWSVSRRAFEETHAVVIAVVSCQDVYPLHGFSKNNNNMTTTTMIVWFVEIVCGDFLVFQHAVNLSR